MEVRTQDGLKEPAASSCGHAYLSRWRVLLLDALASIDATSLPSRFGLAWSISEYLLKQSGCFTLFATHYHELTQLGNTEGVLNRHVTAHTVEGGEITMLYNVADGPCLASFGIHVAQLARFPPSVIAGAKRKVADLEAHRTAPQTKIASAQPSAADAEKLRKVGTSFKALPLDMCDAGETVTNVRMLAPAASS